MGILTQSAFDEALHMIFDPFGKPCPKFDSAHRAAIYEKCSHMSDRAVLWAAETISNGEKIPANLGAAVCNLHTRWLETNPDEARKHKPCSTCHGNLWLDVWRQNGNSWRHGVSRCPACHGGPPVHELERDGVVVMPVGYKGGALLFDRDHGYGALYPVNTIAAARTRYSGIASKALRLDMRPDTKRLAAMSDDERVDHERAGAVGW